MPELGHVAATAQGGGSPVDLLIVFFLLGLAPLVAVSVTSFTRIVVVLGLLRSSLGAPSLPPNIVLTALALMLSLAIMAPTFSRVSSSAVRPYMSHSISASQAIERGWAPLRRFMLRQTRPGDIAAFARIAGRSVGRTADLSFAVLSPAFMVSELRTAFAMGFMLALPFAVIDVVVAAVMTSLGMFMVSPAAISLPFKLLLFVAADGWALVCTSLAASFH